MSANFHHRINGFLLIPSKQPYVPRFSQILIRDLLHSRCVFAFLVCLATSGTRSWTKLDGQRWLTWPTVFSYPDLL